MVTPTDWKEVRLGDIGSLRSGTGFPIRFQGRRSGGVPFYKVSDMNLSGNEIQMYESNNWISESDSRILGATPLPGDSIIFAKVGAAVFLERKRILSRPSCIDNNLMGLIPNARFADVRFLHFALQQVRFSDLVSTTALPSINASGVAEIEIALPSLKEQEAIAEALSDADAAIESLGALIAKKRDIRDAMLFELVVNRDYGNWISFNRDVSLKARIGWQGLTTSEYEISGDCYLVTGTDLNGGAVNWNSCWQVAQERYDQDRNIQLRNNDVLITKDGTIGKVGFVADLQGKATLNSGIFVIRPTTKYLLPEYLRYVMFSPLFRRFLDRLAAGSTISHLYQKDFVNFSFPVPAVDEQISISQILEDVDSEVRSLVAQRKKMRMVKEGMMQDLLTGKVRLV